MSKSIHFYYNDGVLHVKFPTFPKGSSATSSYCFRIVDEKLWIQFENEIQIYSLSNGNKEDNEKGKEDNEENKLLYCWQVPREYSVASFDIVSFNLYILAGDNINHNNDDNYILVYRIPRNLRFL